MYYNTIKQKFCKQTVESSTDFVPFFKDTCYLALSTILTRIVKNKNLPPPMLIANRAGALPKNKWTHILESSFKSGGSLASLKARKRPIFLAGFEPFF